MPPPDESDVATGYLITKIGQTITTKFAEQIEILGIRPKHFGVLLMIDTLPVGTQTDIGRVLGLEPSAMVSILYDLQTRGAVSRVGDGGNRNRLVFELTDVGRRLLGEARRLEREVDDFVLGSLDVEQRAMVTRALETVAQSHGMLA